MKTEIVVITDRSGSMAHLRQTVIDGYNKFIDAQREVPGEARVTYTQFDDVYEVVYVGKSLAEVPKLDEATYQPRNWTALYDAIGKTLNDQGERIAKEKWAELVIVVITTDGAENSSKDFNQERVRAMIKHAESHGWQFVFLAANQDAFAASQSMGMGSNSYTSNVGGGARGMNAAYSKAAFATAAMRSGVQGQTLTTATVGSGDAADDDADIAAMAKLAAEALKKQQQPPSDTP